MTILTLPLGNYMANCYLVFDRQKNAVIIDPGDSPAQIAAQITAQGLHVRAILLTHGHFDHVSAVGQLKAQYACPVYLHEMELALPQALTAGEIPCTDFYGDSLQVGELSFRVIHTPGHSPGSVCLLCEDALFSGDTLFAGSCGRIDLYGGDARQMLCSLRRLSQLEGDAQVLPGHGAETTLRRERAENPYMRQAVQE
ncbi:MAG: MBL fold metallo-hydrolase [Oscillospiraceae bacterium]|jgi:glyoxylase-like metal-dependent hydrolase (beta-lactamase superfamily II)|nr:MBL fold metallo-hydrolase [Oscillospiraceae bacterium]